MNTLVSYDADSDEEISPRRKSTEATAAQWAKEEDTSSSKPSSERRPRRDSDMFDYSPTSDHSESNFAEPPPPKRMNDEHSPSPAAFRTPQNAMPHTSSQASLVSYSGDNEDDIGPVKDLIEGNTPQSELREPKPPARKDELDEEEEEERLIDLALAESKQAMNQIEENSSGTATPVSSGSQQNSPTPPPKGEIVETPSENGDDIRIPPPPDSEVSERLQAIFEAAFSQKNRGVNLNQQIQARQDFSNPMSYERFIEMFEIDEKGTNFSKNIFDPHCFPDNCFYDAIGEEQRKQMEAQQLANAKKIPK